MGLLFEGSSLLPPLCNGIILATFKTSGKIPFSIDLLIKLHTTGVITDLTDLASLREIPSTPLEFDWILLIIVLTSLMLQALKTS